MRTYSTILSLIFVLAFANATKMVSYSDIVYSLMELTEDDGKMEALKKINLSFNETKEKLQLFDKKLKERCERGMRMGTTKVQGLFFQYNSLEQTINSLLAQQTLLAESELKAKEIISQNEEAVLKLQKDISHEKLSYEDKLKKNVERTLIFKRLLNFIEDEITASAKRTTQMGNYKVDKTISSQPSFIELQRIKNDLNEIANNTADPIAKSMIATLIMITQNEKQSTFSDPEIVRRIRNLITQLMEKDKAMIAEEGQSTINKVNSLNELINEKLAENDKKRNERYMNSAEITSITDTVRSLQIEIDGYKKTQKKQVKKNDSFNDLCARQNELIQRHDLYLNTFEVSVKRLETELN